MNGRGFSTWYTGDMVLVHSRPTLSVQYDENVHVTEMHFVKSTIT